MMRGRTLITTLRIGVAALAIGLALPAFAANDIPFAISVDGQAVDGSGNVVDKARATDVALEGVDIQVKFDGLGVKPILNVSNFPQQVNFKTGETVRFLASFNYAAWIARGEVRIYNSASNDNRPIAVVPISELGAAEWAMPANAPSDMDYVLRVYDQDGRFDETRPLPLKHSSGTIAPDKLTGKDVAPGYGEDRTAVRNINVYGGAITVYGKNLPEGHDVRVMGEPVPVDGNNSFVVQRILPSGSHAVAISVLQNGKGLNFSREVEIPEDEWFGIGLADLTVGHNLGNGIIEHTSVDEFPGTWTRGRAAFYLKGKIKGQYILTASADTGEGTLQNMVSGLAGKDPRSFLKRINPNDYYPVYNDSSTAIEDAPTRGKFYVRLERGPSSVMWGNFKSNITGTKFMASNRALYGAGGVYRSESVTKDGNAKVAVDVYAAQPGTVPATDVFRGTGGSAYFLKHRDITSGSETITIEVRNAVTGFVIDQKKLVYATDYNFDHINGVLILNVPLSSNTSLGYENYVIAHYEYEPIATDTDGYAVGGRAEAWAGDHVRLGVSAMGEKQQTADQKIYGADVRVQKSPDTYVEAEVARSEGPGFGSTYSVDGGVTQTGVGTTGSVGKAANAWRVEAGVSVDEVTNGAAQGKIRATYENNEAGFSSPTTTAANATTKWGVETDVTVDEGVAGHAAFSESHVANQGLNRQGDVRFDVPASENVTVSPYAKYNEQTGAAVASTRNGIRADVGVKLGYRWDHDKQAYIFGQATVAQTGTMLRDDRVGVGVSSKLTDRITASAEVSYGTQGADATAAIEYSPNVSDVYRIGYRRDAFRSGSSSFPVALTGDDLGTIVLGARHRFNDEWMAYTEDNFDFFGNRKSLTSTYGIEYTPTPEWAITGNLQIGRVFDYNVTAGKKNPDIHREAGSLAVVYHDKAGLEGKVKGELRHDLTDDGTSEIMSYLLQAGVGMKMSPDWQALANLDVVISDASDSTKDSTYVSGAVGAAYRPAKSDRFNGLLKYNFVYDAPGVGQVSYDGSPSSPSQISHIFSADGTYQLTEKLSLGAKYGVRLGYTQDRLPGSKWVDSQVHLGVIRADYHIVNEWDMLAEARALWSPNTHQTDIGFVAAIYRQLGDNFKVGLGYNFGNFSDDLAHIAHDNHGVFINLIGKF